MVLNTVILAIHLLGALPPLAQSAREIESLMRDSQIQILLGSGEGIEEVIRAESGYVILTKSRMLRVDIEYTEQARPGPLNYKFHFHKPVELR